MITYETARKIGVDACIDKLGRDFVLKHRDTSSSAYGDRGDHAYCFVGVSDVPDEAMDDGLILTSDHKFPYVARCTVSYLDGQVNFLECVLPETAAR
ncbi:MAG: hypothetical protein IKQ97_10945 [Eubacterium sp.]|nr:hypothetical protein [Eubacterium sp.]